MRVNPFKRCIQHPHVMSAMLKWIGVEERPEHIDQLSSACILICPEMTGRYCRGGALSPAVSAFTMN